jgi:Fic family protein
MRLPQEPPMENIVDRFIAVLELIPGKLDKLEVSGRYLHWDELRRRKPPFDLSHEAWWAGIHASRDMRSSALPLVSPAGTPFRFNKPEIIERALHEIDVRIGGRGLRPDAVSSDALRDNYYISSLIEEALTSSQLEGAATTRLQAKEMLRSQRPPRTKDERMIMNSFLAMKRITSERPARLTEEFLLDLHRRLTEDTLDAPEQAGRFRLPSERIAVKDEQDQILHRPPDAVLLPERMVLLYRFANEEIPEYFIPPVLRSIFLHFWLAYEHPFVDGNGRTARALFYWSMLKHGYTMFEYISISTVIYRHAGKYRRSFLYSETSEQDATYFLVNQLEVILESINAFYAYVERKTAELRAIEERLRVDSTLNHRQRALLAHAIRNPRQRYTAKSHQTSHEVTGQTARTDLQDLARRGLLVEFKRGREFVFTPVDKLESRLSDLS